MQCMSKNFIDHDEYPQIEKIHERCVHILADLLNHIVGFLNINGLNGTEI